MNKPKILIIDDDPIIVAAIEDTLKREGYEFFFAENGEEGLALVKKVSPLLVMLDLRMPVMDGLEFLEKIQIKPDSPFSIMMLTAFGTNDDLIKFYALGVNSFLKKPFNRVELRCMVKRNIELKQAEKQLKNYQNRLEGMVEKRTAELEKEIAERKKNENKFTILVENSSDCICHLSLDGKLLYMNPEGKKLGDFQNSDEALALTKKAIIKTKGGETIRVEHESTTQKGAKKWWESIITPIKDAEGNAESFIEISRDITKRKQEEKERDREVIELKKHLLPPELELPDAFSGIVTKNAKMLAVFKYMESIAGSSAPILITGETGVGKELAAKAIHILSKRPGRLVTVILSGVDENTFTDTLFGHMKGSFTGADMARKGLVEEASGGTLFLDEIGDLNSSAQIKLLRLLQEDEYYPLGSDQLKYSDARIIFATNHDLYKLCKSGEFRKDLFFRLNGHQVFLPPLWERLEDIPMLVDHFLEQAAKRLGKKKPAVPMELYTLLSNYHFPGNIRELENIISDAVSSHKSKILSLETIRKKIGMDRKGAKTPSGHLPSGLLESVVLLSGRFPTLKEIEGAAIEAALKRTKSNQLMAAEMLGVSRMTINRYLKKKDEKPE